VFVLRAIEGLSIEETAEVLEIAPATVKTRFLRARRRLQENLDPQVRTALLGTFPFAGADCAAMTERVLAALDA
jgi:RNA polymerase sigma-70 factor (ECF subfamily)